MIFGDSNKMKTLLMIILMGLVSAILYFFIFISKPSDLVPFRDIASDAGIQAANMSHSATENYVPTAMVPIHEVGIQKTEKETNLSVDASKVNPAPRPKKSK